jgi:hypothetical protein
VSIIEDDVEGGEHVPGSGQALAHRRRISMLSQSEVDAMKPVDDIPNPGDLDAASLDQGQAPHGHYPPILSAAPVPSSTNAKENAGTRPSGVNGLQGPGPVVNSRQPSALLGPTINMAFSPGKRRG